MKKLLFIALLVIAGLATKMHQQKQIINNLSNQVAEQTEIFNKVLEQIEEDEPTYFLDVLTETDNYLNYIDYTYNF